MPTKIFEATIERWKSHLDEARSNQEWIQRHKVQDDRRVRVVREMRELLQLYQNDEISIQDLRAIFDKKTRNEWVVFGFKGFSGAMFLNMLVKHIPNHRTLSGELSSAIDAEFGFFYGRRVAK